MYVSTNGLFNFWIDFVWSYATQEALTNWPEMTLHVFSTADIGTLSCDYAIIRTLQTYIVYVLM